MVKHTEAKQALKLTKKQKEILSLLFTFRFLSTTHIQKLLTHKDPHRVKEWLADLLEKGCVKRHYSRASFSQNTQPAIYFLAAKSRTILKHEKEVALSQLEYIYKEHRREKKFINHCLFLADVYLFLNSHKGEDEEVRFFTKTELYGYDYFPDPLPDAFIAVKGKNTTKRYFLDVFDEFTPPFVIRQRVRAYLEYLEKSDWNENTNVAPFPKVLFICSNESINTHIKKYTKALLEKTYEDKADFFLTTKTKIQAREESTIWQKVE